MPNDGIDPGFPWPVAPAGQAAPAVVPAEDDGKPHVWAQKGFQFHDLLDIVNPLQHLPVVSSIYRWITGDGIGNLPRVVGDAIYGGPVGFVSGLLGVLVKEESGKDIGEHMIATLTGDDHSGTGTTEAAAPSNPSAAGMTTAPSAAPAVAAATASSPAPAPSPAPTTPSPSSTAAAPAAAAPTVPDHAPMPLQRGGVRVATATTPAANGANSTSTSAIDVFRKELAQRQLPAQQRTAADGRVLSARPVPLEIPAGALSGAPPAPKVIKVMAPGSSPAAAGPPAGADAATPVPDQPVEISQKMLDALDKYMALQNAQGAGKAARGAQLDVSP